MSVFTEGQIGSKVRVPFSHLANNGDVSMDDIEQASGDPDGAVVVDVQGGGDGGDESIMMAEQAGPRETTDVMEVTDQPAYGAPGGAPPAPGVPSGVATPGAEPAPAPAVPGQPTPAPARARRNIQLESRFNPNVRYTNEDFYGPRGPDIYSDNAVGGKLYIPRAGELPMGLFASFMQESQKRKAKVEGAIADLMKSSQVKPTADPYQPAFAKLVKDWQNNYVAGLAEQYGGNSQLAWGEIAKEGSDANRDYLSGMKAMDALGQFVKFQWADADKYITEVRDGKLRTTPEQKKRAEEVFYGIGNLKGNMAGGDFVKLAQQTEALKRDMNELKWFNEFVLPMAPEAYKKASSEPVVDVVGGKRILRQKTREEVDKEFHRIIAQAGRDMIGADPNELQKKVEAWFPRMKSETEDVKFLPGQGEGGSNGGGEEDGVWVGTLERGVSPKIIQSEEVVSTAPEDIISGKKTTTRLSKARVDRLPIGEIVGKRRQNMGPRKFTDQNGNPVEMRPQYIERDENGAFYIVGRPVAQEETTSEDESTVTETMRKGPGGSLITEKTVQKKGNKPQPDWVSVPVSENEGAINDYLGGQDWRSAFGAASQRAAPAKKASSSDPLGIL